MFIKNLEIYNFNGILQEKSINLANGYNCLITSKKSACCLIQALRFIFDPTYKVKLTNNSGYVKVTIENGRKQGREGSQRGRLLFNYENVPVVFVTRKLKDVKKIEIVTNGNLDTIPIQKWWEILSKSNVYHPPKDGKNPINIITHNSIERYMDVNMTNIWLDFRDNFCYFTGFNELKDQQHQRNREEKADAVNRERLKEVAEIESEDLSFNIALGKYVLENQKACKKLQAQKKKLDEDFRATEIMKRKQRLIDINDEISKLDLELRRTKEEFIQNKVTVESCDLAISELDMYLNNWNSLLVLDPPVEAPDNMKVINKNLKNLNKYYEHLLNLHDKYCLKSEKWNKVNLETEALLAKISNSESMILFLNLKQEKEDLANDYMASLVKTLEEQKKVIGKLESLNESCDNNQEEQMKKAKDKVEEAKTFWNHDVKEGMALIEKIIELQKNLRLNQLMLVNAKTSSIVGQETAQERILNLQLASSVIYGLVEVELLIIECAKPDASAEDQEILNGYVNPIYKCLNFNQMECVIIDEFLSVLPIIVVKSQRVVDLMRARLPTKYSYEFLVFDNYYEDQVKVITRRNLRPFLSPSNFFVPSEERKQALCNLVTRILNKTLVTYETVTLEDLMEYKENLERTVVSADASAVANDGTISGGCLTAKKVNLDEIKQAINDTFEWRLEKLKAAKLETVVDGTEKELNELICKLHQLFIDSELFSLNTSTQWKTYLSNQSATKSKFLLDKAKIKQNLTTELCEFMKEVNEDTENKQCYDGQIKQFYLDIKRLKKDYEGLQKDYETLAHNRNQSLKILVDCILKIQQLEENLLNIDPLLSSSKMKGLFQNMIDSIQSSVTKLAEFQNTLKTQMTKISTNLDEDTHDQNLDVIINQLETLYTEQARLILTSEDLISNPAGDEIVNNIHSIVLSTKTSTAAETGVEITSVSSTAIKQKEALLQEYNNQLCTSIDVEINSQTTNVILIKIDKIILQYVAKLLQTMKILFGEFRIESNPCLDLPGHILANMIDLSSRIEDVVQFNWRVNSWPQTFYQELEKFLYVLGLNVTLNMPFIVIHGPYQLVNSELMEGLVGVLTYVSDFTQVICVTDVRHAGASADLCENISFSGIDE